MERAALSVEKGRSLRSASQLFDIGRNTLKRYMDRKASDSTENLYGYGVLKEKRKIFEEQIKKELADHV